ncbi:MAG: CGGC domain-containing protein [Lachnospiraceae bacterium]|nr:CGGC domain-containing protein [Lachnospiraceae bacterium]
MTERKKIAILACLKANDVCAGASCLRALEERKAAFSVYNGQQVYLCAFARCSVCGKHLEDDLGMQEKLERMISEGVSVVHIGVCAMLEDRITSCPYMVEKASWLEEHGLKVVWGTH